MYMCSEIDGMLLDHSRQHATLETFEKLFKLVEVGATNKALTDVVSIGIGCNYLGPPFVHTALQSGLDYASVSLMFFRNFCIFILAEFLLNVLGGKHTDLEAAECAKGCQLRFCLGNLESTLTTLLHFGTGLGDVAVFAVQLKCCRYLSSTVSQLLRSKITKFAVFFFFFFFIIKSDEQIEASILITNFNSENMRPTTSRQPSCPILLVIPLICQKWTACSRCHHVGHPVPNISFLYLYIIGTSHHVSLDSSLDLQVLLDLLRVWNLSFHGYPARALEKFAPHIQLVSMESNGERVSIDGVSLPFEAGEIDFEEPGTNGLHSFYQLIHQLINTSCISKD
ncbi:Phosphoglucose isomerase (PGI) [Dillenia turbinata]|uniref:Glucose-6-phosphate isomerase n=1 Tax=Dillenia turbinata TaxID=194707 RepID=A0AAN8VW04_9MAGN